MAATCQNMLQCASKDRRRRRPQANKHDVVINKKTALQMFYEEGNALCNISHTYRAQAMSYGEKL